MGELKEMHPDFKRAWNTDTSIEYTDSQLYDARKEYFSDWQIKEDEFLNEQFELISKKCNTKRFFQNNSFVIGCLCECQSEEKRKQVELENKMKRMQRLDKLKDASLLGAMYKEASFSKLDMNRPDDFVAAVERCKNYCRQWTEVYKQGLGIYLYGDVGVGKSLLTACIGNYLLNHFVPVLFTNFNEISKQIRKCYSTNSPESVFIDRLCSVDLLIIDDIGTEILVKEDGTKNWLQEKMYDIVNSRYINRKPTIFSSNESLTELVQKCGLMKKTVDRIAAMSTAKIKLQGSSYRLIEQNKPTIF